ncbi:RGS domain-containing protein [Gaertneriomyces semiglobifer]|nr:RGS domain-containing protein [Gaertneriomyces semiglobifer]
MSKPSAIESGKAPRLPTSSSARSDKTISSLFSPSLELKDVLLGVTKSPASLEQFKAYMLEKERGAESLEFWVEVEKLKALSASLAPDETSLRLTDGVNSLVKKYVRVGAPSELNISSADRNHILKAVESDTNPRDIEFIFGAVQRHCFELMLYNSFPRFVPTTLENIDQRGVSKRERILGVTVFINTLFTVVSWTVPQYPRSARLVVALWATLMFICIFQRIFRFCVFLGLFGKSYTG